MRRLARTAVGFIGFALALIAAEHEASACGGCFTPPPTVTETESVITDEKMVLSISTTQTTLYDEIEYSGSPASFAWVLPIKGTVTVGLSADVMFQVLDQLTATEVISPSPNCSCSYTYGSVGSSEESASGSASSSGGVTVTAQQQVGPYESVQLHSNDGSALTAWLTQHGYSIPASTVPVIQAYVSQHFDFLALKLVPGAGVQAMQPVRVTSMGAAPSLPLHMVAIGTGATTGITIWVVADGRWAPSNFPTFTIDDSELTWDWTTESSNYESVRLAKEATYGGRGWQIESSLELSQYTLEQSVVTNAEYTTQGGYTPLAADGGAAGDGGGPSAQEAAATADLEVLLAGVAAPNVRITRMRSDVAQAALTVDMALGAAADQSELTNVHVPQNTTGTPPCAPGCEPGTSGATSGGVTPSSTEASTAASPPSGGTTAASSPSAGSVASTAPSSAGTSSTHAVESTGLSSSAVSTAVVAGSSIASTTPAEVRGTSMETTSRWTQVLAGGGGCSTTSSAAHDGTAEGLWIAIGGLIAARLQRRRSRR